MGNQRLSPWNQRLLPSNQGLLQSRTVMQHVVQLQQNPVDAEPVGAKDDTFFKSTKGFFDKYSVTYKCVGGVFAIGAALGWGHYKFDASESTFGMGFATTALLVYWWIYILSSRGPSITSIFGSSGANAA